VKTERAGPKPMRQPFIHAPLNCEDCGDDIPFGHRRLRCRDCKKLVCSWCAGHAHDTRRAGEKGERDGR
jgi:hypothetical protein